VKRPAPYRQPQIKYWIKVTCKRSLDNHGIRTGTVFPLAQYLVADGRTAHQPTIRINANNRLVGLFNHEFEYCNEKGESQNAAPQTASSSQ